MSYIFSSSCSYIFYSQDISQPILRRVSLNNWLVCLYNERHQHFKYIQLQYLLYSSIVTFSNIQFRSVQRSIFIESVMQNKKQNPQRQKTSKIKRKNPIFFSFTCKLFILIQNVYCYWKPNIITFKRLEHFKVNQNP